MGAIATAVTAFAAFTLFTAFVLEKWPADREKSCGVRALLDRFILRYYDGGTEGGREKWAQETIL